MSQNLQQQILSRSDYKRGLLNFIENNPGCTSDDIFNSGVANAIIPIGIREEAISLWIKQLIREGYIESKNWKLYPTGQSEWEGHNVITKENKMKLSKRQLKRIIREEYSKLKSQGLIREGGMSDLHIDIQNAIIEAVDDITYMHDNMRGATLEDIEMYINNPRSGIKFSHAYTPNFEEIALIVDDMVAAGDLIEDAAGFLTIANDY